MEMNLRNGFRVGAAILSAALAVTAVACSDDASENDPTQGDGGLGDGSFVDGGDQVDPDPDPSDGGDGDAGGDGSTPPAAAFPSVLSLTGCTSLGISALCSVSKDGDALQANCGGRPFTGTVTANGNVTLASAALGTDTETSGAIACTGRFLAGQLTASCSQTGTDGGTTTCNLVSDRQILPGVTCMELPSELPQLTLTPNGGGTAVNLGTCKVIQDGCVYQAECGSEVYTGAVTRTGFSFTRPLTALADAQTPTNGNPRAFDQGDTVNHPCTVAIDGTAVSGTCVAGASGSQPATSVYNITSGTVAAPPVCLPLAPESEHLFVLDSCSALKDGIGEEPGIGQPVCALRQNNCIWEVNCGNDPLLTFSGRATPGSRRVEWRLATGTPCEAGFSESGTLTGSCTVPGEAACSLSNIPAVPGDTSCPAMPVGTAFRSHGCGGGSGIQCRAALQHKCDFMAVCSFTNRYPDAIIAGQSSFVPGSSRGQLDFNGLVGYNCSVNEATAEEIADTSFAGRVPGEWYGQCTNATGGQCRNNYNTSTGTGFRGFRLFFEQPDSGVE